MMKLWLILAVAVTLLSALQAADLMEELMDLNATLSGTVHFPGDEKYREGATMKNTRFNSNFMSVVYVKTAEDVSKVLRFCRDHDLRPTVKSGGHDYIGRSSGADSVSINLAYMRDMKIRRRDPKHDNGPTITVEPGLTWWDIYQEVDKAGFLVVGSRAKTVSPGGYTLGGGHGPLTPKLGLAVDNTLAFTIVTANGSIITASAKGGTILRPDADSVEPYNDAELWWAVRGGGGGTFGVVTSFTYKLHQPPKNGFTYLYSVYPMQHIIHGNVGEKVLNKWNDYMQNNLTENWSGDIIMSSAAGLGYKGSITFSILHWGGWAAGSKMIEAIMDIYPEYKSFEVAKNYSSFLDYEQNANDPSGFNTFVINRFIQEKDLNETDKLVSFMTGIAELGSEGIGCTWTLLGGQDGAAYSLLDYDSASVNPSFRTSYGSLSCGVAWTCCDDEATIAQFMEHCDKIYDFGDGVYFNEPDFYLSNWKTEFWGNLTRYERLLSVKMLYDPDGMFWCYHCVGSDVGSKIYSPGPEHCATSSFTSGVIIAFSLLALLFSLFLLINALFTKYLEMTKVTL